MKKFDEIYDIIKQRILRGEYPINSRISELRLSKEFKCSRTPIREIFQKLENESLVYIVPRSGTYISDYSKKDLIDFMHVRAYIEALAFKLCISSPYSLDPLVEKLETTYQEMHDTLSTLKEEGMRVFVQLHYNFHECILLFTGNKLLLKFFRELNLITRASFIEKMTIRDIARTEEEHLKIINYIRNRDPEGERFVIQHLTTLHYS